MSVNARNHAEYAPYDNRQSMTNELSKEDVMHLEKGPDRQSKTRRISIEAGQIKHSKLGWKRLTVIYH